MLDQETKRKIDTARDILVGKLPNPQAQVEQITIAMIYKFMDDMDKEAMELGGKPSFFSGEYEKYSWTKIFDPKLGGFEMLVLYGEAIVKLNQNPNIPQLFRDIFKNAFLPYRDPETLKMFLKIINEFHYDHSEKLGDAFEYLLSVLGSQGDAGQFRTPRHIIDFMVAIMQPQKNESICDPACGTAGFLISSYKYILNENTKKDKGDLLTPQERKKLINNFVGYDISAEMVRLSLVNLYLHGFTSPKIFEYDTLTSEDRWGDSFDLILANPPFMTPKGGIRPHKKFTMQANRSEVLFVDYIMEHINPTTGRAAIIVPEGIIFQSATAYKALRKLLVDKKFLYGVVSLPAGIFQPYSGVKTSILLLDKSLAKKTDEILFVKIENDGFGLGAQRKVLTTSDLPDAINFIKKYILALQNNDFTNIDFDKLPLNSLVVEKTKIAENEDYNLSADRYRVENNKIKTKYDLIKIENLIEKIKYTNKIQKSDFLEEGKFPIIDQSELFLNGFWNNEEDVYFVTKPVIIFGDHTRNFKYIDFNFVLGADGVKILKPIETVNSKYFYYCLKNLNIPNLGYSRHWKELKLIKIPLPPLSIQQEIVSKIEQYEKIIAGAKQVVENYKPQIDINPEWEMLELGCVCEIKSGGTPNRNKEEYWNGDIPWLRSEVCKDVYVYEAKEFITKDGFENSSAKMFKIGTTLVALVGATIGKTALLKLESATNQNVAGLYPKDDQKLNPTYLFYSMQNLYSEFISLGDFRMASLGLIKKMKIPLPSLIEQQTMVNHIEKEQRLVDSNKELITIYEQKIKEEINKLWAE